MVRAKVQSGLGCGRLPLVRERASLVTRLVRRASAALILCAGGDGGGVRRMDNGHPQRRGQGPPRSGISPPFRRSRELVSRAPVLHVTAGA